MENTFLNHFLFGSYPYIAFAVFIIASILRYDLDPYSWKADSSQILSGKYFRFASNSFHVGIILLFFGHLVGLMMPHSFYEPYMTPQVKQIIAMTAGGIFGTLCFVGLTILILRRLFNARVRATSRKSDIFILFLLYIQLILGLASIPVSASHPDGSSMLALAEWAQHIVTFRSGASEFILHEHIIFKLHLFFGLTLFLVFPFTRLVHVWSFPAKYLTRTGYQIVRKR